MQHMLFRDPGYHHVLPYHHHARNAPPCSPSPQPDLRGAPNLTTSFDLSRHPNTDQTEVHENSLREPDLPDTILPDVPVSYTVVQEGSNRGAPKLVTSDGYQFTKKVSKGDFTYWRCIKRSSKSNCPATVSQQGTTFKRNARPHNHRADKGALKKVLVKKEVKVESVRNLHKPSRRIVDDAMMLHITPDDHSFQRSRTWRD